MSFSLAVVAAVALADNGIWKCYEDGDFVAGDTGGLVFLLLYDLLKGRV